MPTRAEELPYFTLIQKVIIPAIEHADKERPIAYVIADCSHNENTYNTSRPVKKKDDLYKELAETFKPQALVTLNYHAAGTAKLFPHMPSASQTRLEFTGKDILSRQGIAERLQQSDQHFRYYTWIKKVLEIYEKFIDQNLQVVQTMLLTKKYDSPMDLLRDAMKDARLKNSFTQILCHDLEVETNTVQDLLEKWEGKP